MNKERQEKLMNDIRKEFDELATSKHDTMFTMERYQTNIGKLLDEEFSPEVFNFAMSIVRKLTDMRLEKDSLTLAELSNLTFEQFRMREEKIEQE